MLCHARNGRCLQAPIHAESNVLSKGMGGLTSDATAETSACRRAMGLGRCVAEDEWRRLGGGGGRGEGGGRALQHAQRDAELAQVVRRHHQHLPQPTITHFTKH